MPQLEYLRIRNAIVHLVDPSRKNGVQFSQRELPITPDQNEVVDFLEGQLRRLHTDSSGKYARFVSEGNQRTVASAAAELANSQDGFVAASRRIAEQMHKILLEDKRISGCVLAICLYSARTSLQSKRYFGILKLDPSRVFRPVVKETADGSSFVTLQSLQNVLPASGQRLQKAASVCLDSGDGSNLFDLRVVDHQRSRSEEPAQFFTDNFLRAKVVPTNPELNRKFVECVIDAANQIRIRCSEKSAEKVIRSMHAAVGSDQQIDIDRWIESPRISQQARKILHDTVKSSIAEARISVEPTTAREVLEIRSFRGEQGFRLSIKRDLFDRTVVEGPNRVSDPDRGEVFELVLHAKALREVL